MRGDNPSGAGNQQERPGLEQWVVGEATHWTTRFLESSEAIRRPTRSDTELKIWS